jgi:hypothetical protein
MREVEEVEVDLLDALFQEQPTMAFDILIAAIGDDEGEGN